MVSLFKITDDRTGAVTYRLFDRQRFISPEYTDLTQLEADYSGYAPFPNPADVKKTIYNPNGSIMYYNINWYGYIIEEKNNGGEFVGVSRS